MSHLKEEVQSRKTLRLFPHRMLGKQRLQNNYSYTGCDSSSRNFRKGRKQGSLQKSDWMEIEKQRGISVTSSVLK